jgi:hypothetical protein
MKTNLRVFQQQINNRWRLSACKLYAAKRKPMKCLRVQRPNIAMNTRTINTRKMTCRRSPCVTFTARMHFSSIFSRTIAICEASTTGNTLSAEQVPGRLFQNEIQSRESVSKDSIRVNASVQPRCGRSSRRRYPGSCENLADDVGCSLDASIEVTWRAVNSLAISSSKNRHAAMQLLPPIPLLPYPSPPSPGRHTTAIYAVCVHIYPAGHVPSVAS